MFGLARQVANDTVVDPAAVVDHDAVPAGGRRARRATSGCGSSPPRASTPTAAELERLWFEIQREMTAQRPGREATRHASCSPAASRWTSEVIRIGPFTATADGQFLAYLPELRTLERAAAATAGRVHGDRRTFRERDGGLCSGGRGREPRRLARPVRRAADARWSASSSARRSATSSSSSASLGAAGVLLPARQPGAGAARGQQAAQEPRPSDAEQSARPRAAGVQGRQEPRSRRTPTSPSCASPKPCLREVPKLERFQAFLRLGVAAGPLLGLIGTVVGMIITFQSITESGSSDPKLMATGIGRP